MFLDRNTTDKKLTGQYVVGFDLGDSYSQISYWKIGSKAPATISTVSGQENYNIPTVLCKRKEVNQWFYGKDAIRNGEDNEGTIVKNLLQLATKGEPVLVENEEFDPVRLLALFVRRALSLINMELAAQKVAAYMVTTADMSYRMIEVLGEVVSALHLDSKKVFFQSHMESFYYYMIYQPEELWGQDVILYDFAGPHLISYRMERNRRTTPIVAYIDAQEYPQFKKGVFASDEALRDELKEAMDHQFYQIILQSTTEHLISAAYLIGDGFDGEWEKESLKLLCHNRRAFQGNNLYSKGACYGVFEKIAGSELGKRYVFLGNEKLKSNVGMKVFRQGQESYLALLDAGVNWFEAAKECEVYLGTGNKLSFLITPLTGRDAREVEMELEGLPIREPHTTRLYLSIQMMTETKVKVSVEDLGFGQLFPSTGLTWTKEFE